MHIILCLFSLWLFSAYATDYFAQLEEILKAEKEKAMHGSRQLHSEFASDKPKEVEIICSEVSYYIMIIFLVYCPCHQTVASVFYVDLPHCPYFTTAQTPQVLIRDLVDGGDSSEECM